MFLPPAMRGGMTLGFCARVGGNRFLQRLGDTSAGVTPITGFYRRGKRFLSVRASILFSRFDDSYHIIIMSICDFVLKNFKTPFSQY